MAIDYGKYKAKPIIVDGVLFRSRLEATWALFFNYMSWKWEYEPAIASEIFKGWLPDFALYTSQSPAPIYCEVKPVSQSDDVSEFVTKIADSCLELNNVRAAILGDSLFSGRTARGYGLGMGWTSVIKNGEWMQWQMLMIECICDRGYLEFDPILLEKTFQGKWSAAEKKAKEAYNWTSSNDSMTFWLLDTAFDVREKQQIVINFNR
ncbi:MAG: hypothetical protein RMY28_009335 [Nostoc sp. ChiSLP01]|nr:hypothetical protein [Nostoc sp. CmiSLP01]MDZ8285242.1 hypothetical protein [Nostoc sp. ChiSLP01]